MRNILKLTVALSVLFTVIVSCKRPDEPTEQTSFKAVTQEDVSAAWEGGTYEVEYEIENPTATGVVVPSVPEEISWITDFRTGVYGVVSFKVLENDSDSERTAEITLTYETQELKFTVRQAGKTIEGNSYFRIEASDIQTQSISARVTPSDLEMKYLVLMSPQADMVGFEDDNVLFEDAISYYRTMAANYGVTLREVLNQYLLTGVYEDTFSDLTANTEYCLFAFGVTDVIGLATPIARATIKTRNVDMVDVSFDISVNMQYNGTSTTTAEITYVPSNTETAYLPLVITQTDWDIYGAAMPQVAQSYLKYYINTYVYGGDFTVKDVYDMLSRRGNYTMREDLTPNYNYWAMAFAWDEEGNIASEVSYEKFKAAGPASDNKITLTVDEIENVSARLNVTTTNNDPYWLGVMPASRTANMEDDYLMWSIVDYYDVNNQLQRGDYVGYVNNLTPEYDYVALAFGVTSGTYSTSLSKVAFRTGQSGDAGSCTFNFNVTNIKPRRATVQVVPSDASVAYHWDLFEASVTEDSLKTLFKNTMDYQIAVGAVADAREFWEYTVVRGTDNYTYTVNANTSYRVMAVAIDMNTGDYAGDFYFSEPFTTPAPILSDADITLDYRYYDGDELYARDPDRFSALQGIGLLDLDCTPNSKAASWYQMVLIWSDVYADETVYTDEVLIANLEYGGQENRTNTTWLLREWDREMLILAVAVDADGNYGPVHRERFTPTKDGVSPIDGYVTASASQAPVVENTVKTRLETVWTDSPSRLEKASKK